MLGVFELLIRCLLIIGLFIFPIYLLDSVLKDYVFLEMEPFLLGCIVCWHIIVYSSLMILNISVVSVISALLISNFIYLNLLSLFS